MLHADADFPVAVEGTVEAHYVRGVALVQHLQLSDDLVPDGRFDLQVDQLKHSRAGTQKIMISYHDDKHVNDIKHIFMSVVYVGNNSVTTISRFYLIHKTFCYFCAQ